MTNIKDSCRLFIPLFKSQEDMHRYQKAILLKCCINQSISPLEVELNKVSGKLKKIEFLLNHLHKEIDLNQLNSIYQKNETISEFKDEETAIFFHQTNIFNTCLHRKQYPEQIQKSSYIYSEYCGFYNINLSLDYLKSNNRQLISNEYLVILTNFIKTIHQ